MKKITLAYFGSPSFSALFLEKLITDSLMNKMIEIKFVITNPDRPAGRKKILTATAVKKTAEKYKLKVFHIEKNHSQNIVSLLQKLDLALVYAYSFIFPKEWLNLPKYGFWCIHPSLLPKYRGPSPIAYSLILGEKKTGITIFKMDEKIDHGPIIAQKKLEILETDRRPDLEIKLTNLAFNIFKKIIFLLKDSFQKIKIKPQLHQNATYTRLLKKDDGFIPLSILKKALKNKPAVFEEFPEIIKEYLTKHPKENLFKKTFNSSLLTYNLFRGLYPWPGLWTQIQPTRFNTGDYKRLKITDLELVNNKLIIKKVQLEGKKEVEFTQFNTAYQIF